MTTDTYLPLRTRVVVTAGEHHGTLYAETKGVIVNVAPGSERPYAVRLQFGNFSRFNMYWLEREDFEVMT